MDEELHEFMLTFTLTGTISVLVAKDRLQDAIEEATKILRSLNAREDQYGDIHIDTIHSISEETGE